MPSSLLDAWEYLSDVSTRGTELRFSQRRISGNRAPDALSAHRSSRKVNDRGKGGLPTCVVAMEAI